MNFADRLSAAIDRTRSPLVVGFDPQLEKFPRFVMDEADRDSNSTEEMVFLALTSFYLQAIVALRGKIPAVKPNIAFFEQYGIGGLRAFARICSLAREHGLLVVADAKRGDIGSTAEAYSRAFLGKCSVRGREIQGFDADAVTVNPFLGFDTLEPFLDQCGANERGIFVLVRTSNPGSGAVQGVQSKETNEVVSDTIARWLGDNAGRLLGASGRSGLGAVVGATYPGEAVALRRLMPTNYFLIPGYGAQGGTAADAVAGFDEKGGGGLINVSRGMFSSTSGTPSYDELSKLLGSTADETNADLASALQKPLTR